MKNLDNKVVYVVDDDTGMLDSTRWLLESVGLRVEGFTDGRDFLEHVDPNLGGCIILDVRMPGLGGLNVQEELQSQGIELPVLFISGHADVPIAVRAFKSGAFDFIEKPFNEQLLLDSVQQAIQSYGSSNNVQRFHPDIEARMARLTPREKDVFLPLARGYTSREIADMLGVGTKTVDLYRSRVMKRLGVSRVQDVTGIAIAAGAVDPLGLR
ncbi:LuxR family two component transcriptional regulator [Tamilnaduibacter salinus]|uniref:LuxR family two component transcriptional regulator n=1 Tax=Tamilnaduibacter salinus TaxID=1484056 RepID=A0A2U1CUN7_9GAMM|nr:response regulator [Tamilnaduibacter salinus]PVY70724.1 LuxR family two component transcriptional regulator [Tamilnaduibacter salinus]